MIDLWMWDLLLVSRLNVNSDTMKIHYSIHKNSIDYLTEEDYDIYFETL